LGSQVLPKLSIHSFQILLHPLEGHLFHGSDSVSRGEGQRGRFVHIKIIILFSEDCQNVLMRFPKKERKSLITEIIDRLQRFNLQGVFFTEIVPGNPVLWTGIERASAKGGK